MSRGPYIWAIPEGYPKKSVGLYDELNGPDRFLFARGEEIYGDQRTPRISYEKSSLRDLRKLGCLYNNARLPLADTRLVEAMRDEGAHDFQSIRASVIAKEGETNEFRLINITRTAKCIDYNKSDVVPMATDPNGILTFRRLVLDPKGMGEHAFTRERDRRGLILVSAKARDNLISLKLPGLHFATPDEFFPPPKSRTR